MAGGCEALTEKEKQALRLLLAGHDAKSSAARMGLSVHTVNERLREARRKLAVSSSREAARQLGAAEASVRNARAPDYLVDRSIGDAPVAPMPEQTAIPARRIAGRWMIGGMIMTLSFALLAFAALSGGLQGSSADASSGEPAVAAASPTQNAAKAWLGLVDAGRWNDSWAATGQSFKAMNTSETWASLSQKVRVPLGAVSSRRFMGEEWVPAPPYGYQVLRFRTQFAGRAETTETLTLVRENEEWRVVGYTIG